jgi:Short C-terminal domain
MKPLFTGLLAAYLLHGSVQAQITGKSVPAFTTSAGTVVHLGDTLHLGRGSLPSGEFQYVFIPDNVFTGSQRVNFTSQMSNLTVRVKDLRFQHSTKYGDKTVAVIRANTINGCVDLNAAEDAGEIITAHTRRAAVSAAAGPASTTPLLSTADELAKLKKLYDQKVLTKAEYDAQKAKLLK